MQPIPHTNDSGDKHVKLPKGIPLDQEWLDKTIDEAWALNEPLGRWEEIPDCKLHGEFLGEVDGKAVYAVNCNAVNLYFKEEMKSNGDMLDWVDAGNCERWKFMPDQFWINEVLALDETERAHCIVHEASETRLMREHGWDYAKAHEAANKIEIELVEALDPCPVCCGENGKCECVGDKS